MRGVPIPGKERAPPMFAANAFCIRHAAERDAATLRRLAQLDSRAPLTGRVLVGEVAGEIVAALSTDDGRVVADPFRRTAQLVARLRLRAAGLRAVEENPSLRERML